MRPGQKQIGDCGKVYDCAFWGPIVEANIWPPK
jgi:hypothetical protein